MKQVKCEGCGKEVDENQLDRYGDCRSCRANDKATDMCGGDLNTK